jgi:hypothetical protein
MALSSKTKAVLLGPLIKITCYRTVLVSVLHWRSHPNSNLHRDGGCRGFVTAFANVIISLLRKSIPTAFVLCQLVVVASS